MLLPFETVTAFFLCLFKADQDTARFRVKATQPPKLMHLDLHVLEFLGDQLAKPLMLVTQNMSSALPNASNHSPVLEQEDLTFLYR